MAGKLKPLDNGREIKPFLTDRSEVGGAAKP